MTTTPKLSVVKKLPVNYRQNDDAKLSRHQKRMLSALKRAEGSIRSGECRAVAVVTRHTAKSNKVHKGCLINYGMRDWEDIQVMASYLCSAAMKCPASAEDMDD